MRSTSLTILQRWRKSLRSFLGAVRRARTPHRPSVRPRLEALEDRQVPSVMLVTDTNNAGRSPDDFLDLAASHGGRRRND
jgi:hypothetical protein